MGNSQGSTRVAVAWVGVVVVAAYAALLAVDALVLDPLAALPGRTLGSVYADLDRQGFDVHGDVVGVVVIASIGVGLAAVAAGVTLGKRADAHLVAAWMLGIVAAGAVAAFASGFQLGMDVADGFGIGGEDHGPWAGVLYCTSGIALVAVPVVLVVGERRRTRRTGTPTLAV